MTDTRRTLAALLALFPDQDVLEISPQDARDLIVSALAPPSPVENNIAAFDATGLLKDSGKSVGAAVFNVKDYGAVGNGTADDTTAVVAAIAAAEAVNGIVCFPGKTASYKITGNLNPDADGVGLIGDGYGSKLKFAPTTLSLNLLTLGNGVTARVGMSVASIQLTSDVQCTGAGLYVNNVQGGFFSEVWIRHGGTSAKTFRYGLTDYAGERNKFFGIDIQGVEAANGIGIVVTGVYTIVGWGQSFVSCYVSHYGVGWYPLAGVKLEHGVGVHFTHCEVISCGNGLWITPGTNQKVADSQFIDSSFENVAAETIAGAVACAYLNPTSNGQLFNLGFANVSMSTGYGIPGCYLKNESSANMFDVRFENCWAQWSTGAGGRGLRIEKAGAGEVYGIRWNGGSLSKNEGGGVNVVDGVLNFVVEGADIYGNGGWGVNIASGTTVLDYQIVNNRFGTVTTGGVNTSGDINDLNTGTGQKVRAGNTPKSVNRIQHFESFGPERMAVVVGAALTVVGYHNMRLFVDGAVNRASFNWRVPDNIVPTGAGLYVRCHINWAPTTSDVSGTCGWSIWRKEMIPGTTLITTAPTQQGLADTPSGVADQLQRKTSNFLSALTAGNTARFTIQRDGDTDGFSGGAQLESVELEYYTTE